MSLPDEIAARENETDGGGMLTRLVLALRKLPAWMAERKRQRATAAALPGELLDGEDASDQVARKVTAAIEQGRKRAGV